MARKFIKHKFIYQEDGGYFYRMYPKMGPFMREPEDDKYGNETAYPVPVRHLQFHGRFLEKKIEKGNNYIILENKARITITDTVLKEIEFSLDEGLSASEERELISHIELDVPDEIYDYNFIVGAIYLITPNEVRAL